MIQKNVRSQNLCGQKMFRTKLFLNHLLPGQISPGHFFNNAVFTLCGSCPLWSLPFVVLTLCGPYFLWSLPFVVLTLCGPYFLWSLPSMVNTLCCLYPLCWQTWVRNLLFLRSGRVWSGLVGWLDNMGIRLNSAPIGVEVGLAGAELGNRWK